jgi:hypothetical protein
MPKLPYISGGLMSMYRYQCSELYRKFVENDENCINLTMHLLENKNLPKKSRYIITYLLRSFIENATSNIFDAFVKRWQYRFKYFSTCDLSRHCFLTYYYKPYIEYLKKHDETTTYFNLRSWTMFDTVHFPFLPNLPHCFISTFSKRIFHNFLIEKNMKHMVYYMFKSGCYYTDGLLQLLLIAFIETDIFANKKSFYWNFANFLQKQFAYDYEKVDEAFWQFPHYQQYVEGVHAVHLLVAISGQTVREWNMNDNVDVVKKVFANDYIVWRISKMFL